MKNCANIMRNCLTKLVLREKYVLKNRSMEIHMEIANIIFNGLKMMKTERRLRSHLILNMVNNVIAYITLKFLIYRSKNKNYGIFNKMNLLS